MLNYPSKKAVMLCVVCKSAPPYIAKDQEWEKEKGDQLDLTKLSPSHLSFAVLLVGGCNMLACLACLEITSRNSLLLGNRWTGTN